MSSEAALSPTHPPPTELSGTLDGANLSVPHQLRSVASFMSFSSCGSRETISSGDGEEQALEGHKVIELQAFSERRAWIEEKIKFLEQLPPINIFVGLDAVRSSATTVPGLPTREELQQWVAEHDRIEKETEIFDSGELKKLKKFTKAATQRNLSPADTDLIEITLTTIYSLDKLLHLLRSRSDSLELMELRLTWEEFRCGAWLELQKVVVDLESFMKTRARWSPAVYNTTNIDEESTSVPRMPRRDSTVSIASSASETSLASLGFSRGARFKLAELLSKDAAQYASRISSLRHSKIVAAGKTLDKLIDRRPVPDELLDEQDHLEDKGINELQDIGKFVMNMVMQWKKADEIYVETMKDKADAQTLLEEIEAAKLHHPSPRQDSAFLSRTNALTQRLSLRGNPASSSSSFPCPTHPLFPDQGSVNDEVVQLLSTEYSSALEHVEKAEAHAKQYHASLEAVKRVDAASHAAAELSSKLASLTERLEKGMEASNGDGTPPDLSTVACLETSRHSVFLALLPSTASELQALERDAEQLIRGARAALLDLDHPGIDAQYKLDSADTIDSLAAQSQAAGRVRDAATGRAATLKKVRSIWAAMGGLFQELADIRDEVADTMERQVWKQEVIQDAAPPTPESPTSTIFPSLLLPATVASQIDDLRTRLDQNVSTPFDDVIGAAVGTDLSDHMNRCSSGLTSVIASTREMVRFWERVQVQAAAMVAIRDDVHDMQILMENLKVRFDEDIQQVLAGTLSGDLMSRREDSLLAELGKVQQTVRTFTENLLPRVPFVGNSQMAGDVHSSLGKRRFSLSGGFSLEILQKGVLPELPFDPASLDQSVRSDANSYCMMLSGGLKSLEQKVDYLQLVKTTQAIDIAVASLVNDIHYVEEAVMSLKDSYTQTMEQPVSLEYLTQCANNLDLLVQDRDLEIARSFPSVRILLRGLSTAPGNHDPIAHDNLVTSRRKAVKDAELQFNTCRDSVKALKRDITTARQTELTRLEEIARLKAEEQARVARELHEAEERARIERETQEAEARVSAERERLQAEEMARIEQEHAEAAQRERLEQERLEAEERDRAERAVLEAREQEQLELKREDAKVRAEAERVESERVELELERMDVEELARQERQREKIRGENQTQPKLLQQDPTKLAPVLEPSLMPAFDEPQVWPLKEFIEEDGVPFLRPRILEDVFGPRIIGSSPSHRISHETGGLQVRILSLRKRLRSLGINELARPATNSSASLPNHELRIKKEEELTAIAVDANSLSVDHSFEIGLRSLQVEIEATMELMKRIHQLADFSASLYRCDDILSDLLEHIDSYPSPPMGSLLASHTSDFNMPPEEQLSARLTFTKEALDDMVSRFNVVADDRRAILERDRIIQTWDELHAMGSDRINGQKSRPASVISSGRSSRASINSTASRKAATYSKLSTPSTRGRFLAPPAPSSRRSVSNSSLAHTRVPSKILASPAIRAVSGPLAQPSPSIRGSTFSSRQRTSSVSSNASSAVTPVKKVFTPGRPRALTSQRDITASPAISEMASRSQSRMSLSRQSISHSSWARAPRPSFPAIQSPPLMKASSTKKKYVANPKNKLDVAVGEVVNNLPVSINIEVVADTWKDQSGKYWIGDEDPKLCFCRILRSQTVMVRVGGGWSELSKFIKDHFADAFRILPESPSRMGTREERWISSASLSQQSVELNTHPRPPQTPEPKNNFIPSFALLTPSGTSSHSIKSSPGSPPNLNALQFLRRSTSSRPETPSKSSRSAIVKPISPGRQPVWRP